MLLFAPKLNCKWLNVWILCFEKWYMMNFCRAFAGQWYIRKMVICHSCFGYSIHVALVCGFRIRICEVPQNGFCRFFSSSHKIVTFRISRTSSDMINVILGTTFDSHWTSFGVLSRKRCFYCVQYCVLVLVGSRPILIRICVFNISGTSWPLKNSFKCIRCSPHNFSSVECSIQLVPVVVEKHALSGVVTHIHTYIPTI